MWRTQKRKQRRKRERRREEEGEQRRLFEASFNVDADETEGQQRAHDEPQTTSSKMKKKTFDEYAEELYQLDMEDVVAGEPTRFKYRPVPGKAHIPFSVLIHSLTCCRTPP